MGYPWAEARWLRRTEVDRRDLGIGQTLVHISDLHYRGDASFAETIVTAIRACRPTRVFFTGDLVEGRDTTHLTAALEHLTSIGAPVYAVLGNHDPVDAGSLRLFRSACASTGGRLLDYETAVHDGLAISGIRFPKVFPWDGPEPHCLLCHYPSIGELPFERKPAQIFAGHSHGGQIRLPLIGALRLPPGVGPYERGAYATPAGPLYVNVGVGTYRVPVRLLCRPEITVFRT